MLKQKPKANIDDFIKNTHGGPRPGAGRPATGAMPSRAIRMTDEEYIKVKEFLKELRKPQ